MKIGSDDVVGRQVANFAGSGSDNNNHKRKSKRRVKSVRDVDQAFASISSVISFNCGIPGISREIV